jgi:opacity protein-like surface antigen
MKDNSFTWSLGAGISAKITNRLNMDIGYRYYDMGDGELNVYNGKTETDAHEVYMGLRYVL